MDCSESPKGPESSQTTTELRSEELSGIALYYATVLWLGIRDFVWAVY